MRGGFKPRCQLDQSRLAERAPEIRIHDVRISANRFGKVEDVLIEEWHLYIRVRIVKIDRGLKRSARDRNADACGEVLGNIEFKIVQQDEKFSVGRRERKS